MRACGGVKPHIAGNLHGLSRVARPRISPNLCDFSCRRCFHNRLSLATNVRWSEAAKAYHGVWFDNRSKTGPVSMKGDWFPKTNTMEFSVESTADADTDMSSDDEGGGDADG